MVWYVECGWFLCQFFKALENIPCISRDAWDWDGTWNGSWHFTTRAFRWAVLDEVLCWIELLDGWVRGPSLHVSVMLCVKISSSVILVTCNFVWHDRNPSPCSVEWYFQAYFLTSSQGEVSWSYIWLEALWSHWPCFVSPGKLTFLWIPVNLTMYRDCFPTNSMEHLDIIWKKIVFQQNKMVIVIPAIFWTN